jgi:hypothetical protein
MITERAMLAAINGNPMNKHVTLTIRWQRFEAYDGSNSRLKPFVTLHCYEP